MEVTWNPWHGCHKLSAGCRHCYVFREDAAFGTAIASDVVRRTANFNLPIKLNRQKELKFPKGTLFPTCFTSDFFLEDADEWRDEAWRMMRVRRDCSFFIITKRIDRFVQCIPDDWGDGWDNVAIGCTVENQDRADYRLPIFLKAPIKHKLIIAAPLLEPIDITPYLDETIETVSASGESGAHARVCDYRWIMHLRQQCVDCGVHFNFHQTGSFLLKDGKTYRVPRPQQISQARKAGIDT